MAIKTSCPHCEQPLSAVDEDVGKERICPVCENEWVVPSKKIEPYAVFGDYSTTRPLGVGGNCEVHLALHKGTGQQVALKIFFVDDVDQKDCMRFEKEIRHITTIEHPGIIRAFDGGFEKRLVIERDGREREEAYYFLAMEYVQGETLDDILDSNGPMDEYEAVRIATRLAVVMEFLWENYQIMHRDLKPGNVMHSYSGEVKLMDFGIAKSAYDAQLTGARTIVGTPYYMSPEQCTPSRTIDLRSDIYGLGATLYHMVTGEFPFDGDDPMEIVRRQIFDPMPSPKIYNPDLSDHLVAVIDKMMQKSPAKRHQCWSEVVVELRAML